MDVIELTRSVASRLHAQAVDNGLDPLRPYAFAVAEAKRRGIDVESAASGADILNGSTATFIQKDSLIVYDSSGTPFTQAFLVAHELAHIELGDDPDQGLAQTVDITRQVEPASEGLDEVVDYGRHQRREIQMDLFALEFLLPRALVRKLHVNEGLTASVIAEQFGAPIEVVAQQLLDGLLLPVITETPQKAGGRFPLNTEQQSAAAHRGCGYLLEAGPGTGKTQTLTARVEGLLADGVDPRKILVLTFSNKAATEMAERIALSSKEAAAAMWIGTFHAFGLDLIRRFYSELGLPKDPRMMDRTEAVELIEAEFPRLNLNHYRNHYDPTQIIADILSAISRAKDEVVSAASYAELAAKMVLAAGSEEERIAAEKAGEVARVYSAYEALKLEKKCVDFGDLVSLPVSLLEESEAIRAHLAEQYDHVLVDEYQDVNRSSVRLLTLLKPSGQNLWVVGDAKQSIYRFRGASSFNMARFGLDDFPGAIKTRLKVNYRSVSEVVDPFSAFANDMIVGGENSTLVAFRGNSGHRPELQLVEQADQQVVALADSIEQMRGAGHGYRDQVVLCTGNEKLSDLGQELEQLGVPVLFLGSLFEREEIRDLLAYLSLLVDGRAMGLLRVGLWEEFALTLAETASIIEHLGTSEDERANEPASWVNQVDEIPGLSGTARASLTRLRQALLGFGPESDPWGIVANLLLNQTRVLAKLSVASTVREQERSIAIWQFMGFLRAQPVAAGLPIRRLLDRIRRLVRLGDERDLRQLPAAAQGLDAVRLMTIHGSKGLEFPVVHIPGMNADTLPRSAQKPSCPPPNGMIEGAQGTSLEILKTGHQEEQECLFFVAMSRARDRLFFYAPTKKSNGHKRAVSPFIARLGIYSTQRQVIPNRQLPVKPNDIPIGIRFEGFLRFSESQLSLYESCPRRFFYTHVLGVGGRRTPTPFMQMHEAVRSVMNAERLGDDPVRDDQHLMQKITAACLEQGLGDHGYLDDYLGIAVNMLRFFRLSRDGFVSNPTKTIDVILESGMVSVRPDEVLMGPNGAVKVRRIRTGHRRSDETKDVAAAAFLLAVNRSNPGADVELVHLSDETVTPVTLSATELGNRQVKLTEYLEKIGSGRFPAEPSQRVCPGCPAFVCGTTPSGNLLRKS